MALAVCRNRANYLKAKEIPDLAIRVSVGRATTALSVATLVGVVRYVREELDHYPVVIGATVGHHRAHRFPIVVLSHLPPVVRR